MKQLSKSLFGEATALVTVIALLVVPIVIVLKLRSHKEETKIPSHKSALWETIELESEYGIEEVVVVKIQNQTLYVPKNLIKYSDVSREHIGLIAYYPSFAPRNRETNKEYGTEDLIRLTIHARGDMTRYPRSIDDSTRFGTPNVSDFNNEIYTFENSYWYGVQTTKVTGFERAPFLFWCSKVICRGYYFNIPETYGLLDFHPSKLPLANEIYLNSMVFLDSLYCGNQSNKGINLTGYRALLRCADIFTSPKRSVTGKLSQR